MPLQAFDRFSEQLEPNLAADAVGSGDGGKRDPLVGQGLVGALFRALGGSGVVAPLGGLGI